MTLFELADLLEGLGYPLAYYEFKSSQAPPFIVYLATPSDNFSADNTTYHEITSVDIELYVEDKNPRIENEIKQLLKSNELPFSYVESYIREEGVFQCVFSVQLL